MLNKQFGLTTIELMVTIVLAAILIALAAPAFNNVMQNNRATNFVSEFMGYLHVARSEAIKRGVPVSICAAGDANQNTCSAAANWSQGWLVFADNNGDGNLDDLGDRIKVHQALNNGETLSTGQALITFSAEGFVTSGAGTYDFTATGCTGDYGRRLTLTSVGRISVEAFACTP